jgi:very-short-patch-repair endonuclease
MAAILACGEGAVLSHRSAAALYGIASERPGVIEVSVRRLQGRQHPGLRVRRRPSLPGHDVGTLNRIPVTSPVRTMVDLATVLGPRGLERAVNEADKHDLVDPESLRIALDDHAGEPGVKALRTLLDRDTFRLSDQELELLFRPLALSAGLPLPMTKQIVNGFEVDFHWPELGLVVETDGLRYHRTPSAQSRDALRDQVHTASGLTPLRFSHWQVKYDPAHVRRVLTDTAAHLRAPAAASSGPT